MPVFNLGALNTTALTAPDVYIDASDGPDGGDPYMWGHVFWDKSGGIDLLQCNVPQVDDELNQAVRTGSNALYVQALEAAAIALRRRGR